MADVNTSDRGRKAAVKSLGLRWPKRRGAVRIDMTPMVDVAFLLLIFFMVTTVFRQPLAMEVNLPEPEAKVEVPESNVLTVYIGRDDSMRYKVGTAAATTVGWDDLVPLFEAQAQANPNLIILVKIHPEAPYERMVDMMDLLDEAHMERFSLVRLTEEDEAALEGTK